MNAKKPIALVGLSGAGKSSVAACLGERWGMKVADLDAMIEVEEGCPVAEYFARHGEPAFRRRERQALDQAVGRGDEVVACGGGVVLDAAARRILRERCHTVWLEVRPETAARRLQTATAIRPLLSGASPHERLESLLQERATLYAEVGQARVATDERSLAEVVQAVAEALRLLPR